MNYDFIHTCCQFGIHKKHLFQLNDKNVMQMMCKLPLEQQYTTLIANEELVESDESYKNFRI